MSEETGIPYLTLLLDMNLSVLRLVTPYYYRLYRFYDKSRRARDQIVTEYRMHYLNWAFNRKNRPLTGPSPFSSKQLYYPLFSEFLGRQWLYAPDVSDQQIEDFLCAHKIIIVKPGNIGRGIGVRKVSCSEVTDMKAFCESARKECLLLEEVVEQHSDLNSINPYSVNTLRINAVVDRTGIPHIVRPALRMGVGQSITDNVSSGGLFAQIDFDTGVLFTPAIGSDLQTYIKHPTSGVILPGFQIPHWEAAKKMVLGAARVIPQIRWIGWDVAITEKGPLLIEGNTGAGIKTMQLPTQSGVYHIMRSYL